MNIPSMIKEHHQSKIKTGDPISNNINKYATIQSSECQLSREVYTRRMQRNLVYGERTSKIKLSAANTLPKEIKNNGTNVANIDEM